MAKRATQFEWDKLNAYLQVGMAKESAAALMDCSADTVERRIKSEYDVTFKEYRENKLSFTKHKLLTKAIDSALSGNVALHIFCLKNLCNWSDRVDTRNSLSFDDIEFEDDNED